MSNTTLLHGLCPPPFFQESLFPNSGGYIPGRFCSPISTASPLVCCLPCPSTDLIYPSNFESLSRGSAWVNVAGLILSVFMLISFAVLPVDKTRRHYLSVCLIIGVIMLELGFIIPLGAQPEQCFDEITPNDMYSNLTCAWSGAFIVAGGLTVTLWIFLRALSMHLQIVWDIVPGKRFFFAAQALGWGVPAILLATTLAVTGVSFRFGDACHVNHYMSMADLWGPLLGFAGLGTLCQLVTFIYCIYVYLKNLWSDDKTETQSSSGLPSYTGSMRTQTARAVWRRIKKVIWLQWRGLVIVVVVLVDVIFFCIVFVYLDRTQDSAKRDIRKIQPWLGCLVLSGGKSDECARLGQEWLVNEATVMAVLFMLSFAGLQVFLLLGRISMFPAWTHYLHARFIKKREFVSLDARRFSADARTYELLKVGATPNPNTVASPKEVYQSPLSAGSNGMRNVDYFGDGKGGHGGMGPHGQGAHQARRYESPNMSFSSPRVPARMPSQRSAGGGGATSEWDPMATHARGGLGMNPMEGFASTHEYGSDGMGNKI